MPEQPEKSVTNCWGYALHQLGVTDAEIYVSPPTLDELTASGPLAVTSLEEAELIALQEKGYEWLFHALIIQLVDQVGQIGQKRQIVKHFYPFSPTAVVTEPLTQALERYEKDPTFRAVQSIYLKRK